MEPDRERALNMSDFSIRFFAADDLERVQDIAELAWKPIFDSYRNLLGEEILSQTRPLAEKDKRDQLGGWAKNHPDKIIVAVDKNQKIIGFATWNLDEVHKVGIINNNAVDKTCGLKGVGQALYAELFRIFKEAGMTLAQVTTGLDEGHAPARKAYQRAGFGKANLESVTYYKKL